MELDMLGAHQAHNAAVAAAAIDVLRDDGLTLNLTNAVDRLAKLRIPGRIEVLCRQPLIILDVAHNDASAAALSSALSQLPPEEAPPPGSRILIYGTSADKEWAEILQSLAKDYDHVVLTSFLSNPRAVPARDLAQQLPPEVGAKVSVTSSPVDAWNLAASFLERRNASGAKAGLVCITGSFYLAAEFRELLRNAFEKHTTVESIRY
jgi:dihydrofolate synthase/folylpolyglutamate synthase